MCQSFVPISGKIREEPGKKGLPHTPGAAFLKPRGLRGLRQPVRKRRVAAHQLSYGEFRGFPFPWKVWFRPGLARLFDTVS